MAPDCQVETYKGEKIFSMNVFGIRYLANLIMVKVGFKFGRYFMNTICTNASLFWNIDTVPHLVKFML